MGVSKWSTIRIKHNAYSVPSRLIGETVRVRIYEDRLEVSYGGEHQLTVERLLGRMGHRINYRHVIWSLVRKPRAFRRYKYRDDLFPTTAFRRAYDALCEAYSERKADLEYLRVLHRAASTLESEVEAALELLLAEGVVPADEQVQSLVTSQQPERPELEAPEVDLRAYDALLSASGEEAR